MAERKHIIPKPEIKNTNAISHGIQVFKVDPCKCSIIGFLVFVLSATQSYATAWLPEADTYNLYSGHSYIDARSRKIRNMRKENCINIQNDILDLSMVRATIRKEALDRGRELLNSELRNIEQIEKDIAF